MWLRRGVDWREIVANDGSRLRELLHPDRGGPEVSYSVAVARVDPGEATAPHRLEAETELYLFIGGSGRMHVDEESAQVGDGDLVFVPAGSRQWVECSGDEPLRFLVVVSPPWLAEHDLRSPSGRL